MNIDLSIHELMNGWINGMVEAAWAHIMACMFTFYAQVRSGIDWCRLNTHWWVVCMFKFMFMSWITLSGKYGNVTETWIDFVLTL